MIKDLPSIHFSIIAPNMVMITRSNDLWVRLGFKFTSPPFHTRLSTLFEDLKFYNISKTKSTKVSFLQRVRTEKAGKSTYKWPQGSVASQPRYLELILVCQYNSSQSRWMSYSWERWITPFPRGLMGFCTRPLTPLAIRWLDLLNLRLRWVHDTCVSASSLTGGFNLVSSGYG